MATTPSTNPLCRYINDEEDKVLREFMIDELVTKRITNQHGKAERVNLCEKLKKFEDNLRKLKKPNITPDHDRYEEYIELDKKLNEFIRLIHKELDDIKRHQEIIIGGNSKKRKSMKRKRKRKRKSMKRKSMKRKSMKRKYSKRN
tara:strand:- start:507 stop:941 length:435 start_codon:yes stop_codon:yes gene_type:complete